MRILAFVMKQIIYPPFSSHCVCSRDVHLGSACWGRDDDREIVWVWTSVEAEVPIGFQAIGTNAPALGHSIFSLKARTGSHALSSTEPNRPNQADHRPSQHPTQHSSSPSAHVPSHPHPPYSPQPPFPHPFLPPPKFPFLSLPLSPYLNFPSPPSPQRPSQSPTPSAPKSTTARSSCPAPPAASAASRH